MLHTIFSSYVGSVSWISFCFAKDASSKDSWDEKELRRNIFEKGNLKENKLVSHCIKAAKAGCSTWWWIHRVWLSIISYTITWRWMEDPWHGVRDRAASLIWFSSIIKAPHQCEWGRQLCSRRSACHSQGAEPTPPEAGLRWTVKAPAPGLKWG